MTTLITNTSSSNTRRIATSSTFSAATSTVCTSGAEPLLGAMKHLNGKDYNNVPKNGAIAI